MVIEDEPSAQELLTTYLQPSHYRTETAGAAAEGLAKARLLRPDLITLDLLLPGRTGWQILRDLKQMPETRDIPVLVISVLDEDKAALTLGAAAYLRKPLKKEALLRAVRENLPGRVGSII